MPILAASPSSFVINPIDHQSRDTGSRLGDRLRTQFSLTNQGVFFPSAKLQYQTAVPGTVTTTSYLSIIGILSSGAGDATVRDISSSKKLALGFLSAFMTLESV
jgi:hypothetical protein